MKSEKNRVVAVGRVSRVFFASERFSAGILKTNDGDEHKFSGAIYIKEGDRIRVEGTTSIHEKYGRQLNVDSFSYDSALDANALSELLAKDNRFFGVGKVRAERIVAALGSNFQESIESKSVEEIATASGVAIEIISVLKEVWLGQIDLNRTMAGLAKWGVSPGAAKRLFDAHGSAVVRIVEVNPYWLIGRSRGFAFKSVDKIAVAAGVPKDHPGRIEEAIKFVLGEFSDSGHTWTSHAELLSTSEILLEIDTLDGKALISGGVDRLVSAGEVMKAKVSEPLNWESAELSPPVFGYWLRSIFKAEVEVVGTLRAVSGHAVNNKVAQQGEVLAFEPRLNARQVEGVEAALGNRISVLTGGAGVGKTFTIRTIAALCQERGLSVLLCAPTGKAAKRITESVGMPAQTIHMALEPHGVTDGEGGRLSFAFNRSATNKLSCDVVIVDEFSMVDVGLACSLFRAIDFSSTRLVLVGDHNQLASVGPGAILRDLVGRPGVFCKVTVLDEVLRQAGVLKENVSQILSGSVAKTVGHYVDMKSGEKVLSPWAVVSSLSDSSIARNFVEDLFRTRLEEFSITMTDGTFRKVDPVWDVQLLTPMHKGAVGTIELNAALQAINQKRLGREVPAPKRFGGRTPFMPGDKVVQMSNNYKLGIMNGTIGKVLRHAEKGGGVVVDFFEEREVELSAEDTGKLAFAYAMTVHKSQGSEWPVVVYVCHKGHQIMFSRNLFYTGVSRARKSAVILGDVWAINQCARTLSADKRRTMLALPGEVVNQILSTSALSDEDGAKVVYNQQDGN